MVVAMGYRRFENRTENEGFTTGKLQSPNKRIGILNSHGLWLDTYVPQFFAGFQCCREGKFVDNKREAVSNEGIGVDQGDQN